MDTSKLKKEIHQLIDKADDKTLKLIYNIIVAEKKKGINFQENDDAKPFDWYEKKESK